MEVAPGYYWVSYNLYRGSMPARMERLLKDILRKEWGFDGVVVSDWGGVINIRTGDS